MNTHNHKCTYFYPLIFVYLYDILQDNPSDKDVNQGTLVVFNLDASVSNDDLLQIFGVYGEVKEVRCFPTLWHFVMR